MKATAWRNRKAAFTVLLAGFLLGLGYQSALPAQSPRLESWLNTELLPFLENRLGRHPRLRGQPFEVVAMKDGEPLAEMDGLTAYIRQRIIDHLQWVAGANLVERPAPRRLSELACPEEKATALVGIELSEPWGTEELYIAVQAIDLIENDWVPGFKKVWIGRPTAVEKERRAKRFIDQNRRGSRALPFRDDQPDLLARHLAQQLSCLLQESGVNRLKVFMPGAPDGFPPFLKTAFKLLDHYLGRFQEVEISKNQRQADVVLEANAYRIDPQLYQVAALLRPLDSTVPLYSPGIDAYVYLASAKESPDSRVPLIGLFQLIAPRSQIYCQYPNPWVDGKMVLTRTSRLPSGGCFALRFQAVRPASLYLVGQTDNGRLTRLFPDSCDFLGLQASLRNDKIGPGQQIHAPLFEDRRPGFFRLDGQVGVEWLYAIAVADSETEAKFLNRIRHTASLCNPQEEIERGSIQKFQTDLSALAKESGGRLDWQVRSFVHTP